MRKYQSLKKQYPEYVSLDQLYRICKISKKSARYLVESGTIPAIDSGKKTWRYKIAMGDVIKYLIKRDKAGSMIPMGRAANCVKDHEITPLNRRSYFKIISTDRKKKRTIEYFRNLCSDFDDLLFTEDIVAITGLSSKTILRLLRNKCICSIGRYPRYLIPKEYLLNFLVTPRFLEIRTKSEKFNEVLDGLEKWLA